MNKVAPAVVTAVAGALAVGFTWWSISLLQDPPVRASEMASYQRAEVAAHEHELLASDQEAGKLETELKLIELELKQFNAIKESRALTPEEASREEYLKQRRAIIEQRLLDTTKPG